MDLQQRTRLIERLRKRQKSIINTSSSKTTKKSNSNNNKKKLNKSVLVIGMDKVTTETIRIRYDLIGLVVGRNHRNIDLIINHLNTEIIKEFK